LADPERSSELVLVGTATSIGSAVPVGTGADVAVAAGAEVGAVVATAAGAVVGAVAATVDVGGWVVGRATTVCAAWAVVMNSNKAVMVVSGVGSEPAGAVPTGILQPATPRSIVIQKKAWINGLVLI
jgi:hypothetical protein